MRRCSRSESEPVERPSRWRLADGGSSASNPEASFDLVASATAWHWVDPTVAMPKAAAILRPAGTLALFWNYDDLAQPTQAALADVYLRSSPQLLRSVVLGSSRHTARPPVSALYSPRLFSSFPPHPSPSRPPL